MRTSLGFVIVIAISAAAGCSNSSSPADGVRNSPIASAAPTAHSTNAQATLKFWNDMNALIAEEWKVRSKCKDFTLYIDICKDASRKINALSIQGVDSDVSTLAVEISAWYHDEGLIIVKAKDLMNQWLRVQQYYKSPEAATEALLRCLMGDPLAKADEAIATNNLYAEKFDGLKKEHGDHQKKLTEVNRKGGIIRIKITEKYGVVFPELQ